MNDIQLKPIDLTRHFDQCQQLRAVAYQASFGSLAGFELHYGEHYRERLAAKLSALPEGNCHLWLGQQIIGQTEAKFIADPRVGYINLLAILPRYQRSGYGQWLLSTLQALFQANGKSLMQLSVSQTNQAALTFYERTGWQVLMPKPDNPQMLIMQKRIENTDV